MGPSSRGISVPDAVYVELFAARSLAEENVWSALTRGSAVRRPSVT